MEKGDVCARVSGEAVITCISGRLRGMLQEGISVYSGMKVGDVDPRGEAVEYENISDKARAIGGGVLEAFTPFFQLGFKVKQHRFDIKRRRKHGKRNTRRSSN